MNPYESGAVIDMNIGHNSATPAPVGAPVRDYPPLPDFETVEQHIYGACRRYITQDMLEPIHNLIRDAIDADRAMRAQAAPAADGIPGNFITHRAKGQRGAAETEWG